MDELRPEPPGDETRPGDEPRPAPEPASAPARCRVLAWAAVALLGLALVWASLAGKVLVNADPDPPRADAVVVLSGERIGHRLRRAIEVFQRTGSGLIVALIPSSEGLFDLRQPAQEMLDRAGVPREAVRFVTGSDSTAGEARVIAGLAERCGWRTVTVVTVPYHTRRAGWLFGRALPDDVSVVMASTPEPFASGAWFTDEASTEHVLIEWMKIASSVRYLVGGLDAVDPGVDC